MKTGARGRAGEDSRCIKSKVKLTSPGSAGSKNGFRQRETKKSKMGKNPVQNFEGKNTKGTRQRQEQVHQDDAQPSDKD